MFRNVSELSDVVSVLVYCVEDDSYMLAQDSNTNEFWIPSMKTTESWCLAARKLVKDVLNFDSTTEKAAKFYRVWLPSPAEEIHHIVFKVPVSIDIKKKNKAMGTKSKLKIAWLTDSEVMKPTTYDNLRSPELVDLIAIIKGKELIRPGTPTNAGNNSSEGSWKSILGYEALNPLVEILEKHVIVSTEAHGDVTLTASEQLVEAAALNKAQQSALFKQFLLQCFPCMYMSKQTFSNFLLKLGWTKDVTADIFRSADLYNTRGLSFRDFLYIIAALEPNTQHGGAPAELRCRYIFRYYDKNNDSKLEYTELKLMIQHVRKAKNLSVDAGSINKEAAADAKSIGIEPESPVPIADFLRAVGSLKLRGTSALLRSPKSIINYLQDTEENPDSILKTNKSPPPALPAAASKQGQSNTSKSSTPKSASSRPTEVNDYEVAVHAIKLKKSGTIIDTDELWNIDAVASKSSNFTQKMQFQRLFSMDAFSQKSVPNELLRGLHYFAQPITSQEATKKPGRKPKEAYTWGLVDPSGFANCLLTICDRARDILKDEPRLLEISSPAYVLGDLHGNFPDLMYFEKVLWHLGPTLTPSTLLFLGDYVDRGPHGVEVIAYLFAYKVQNPKKLKLLRGNHEVREVQKMFSFLTECTHKFGDVLGSKVWNTVNSVFDTMPVAATIDSKIFCCHGGIPPPWLCPVASAINSIPCPLSNPDEQSALAWEIMWNDPVRQQRLTENVAMELVANEGFAVNSRRGTAHMFSVEALERFLMVNGFTHVVRAHEVQQTGFQVQQKGKLITVFSSSRYCGGTNEAACVLADHGKLRMFRLDTS